jgi:hypothetical protein
VNHAFKTIAMAREQIVGRLLIAADCTLQQLRQVVPAVDYFARHIF